MRSSFSCFVAVGVMLLIGGALSAAVLPDDRDLVVVDVSERGRLEIADLPVIWKGAAFFVGEWDADQLDTARKNAIAYETVLVDVDPAVPIYLIELRDEAPLPKDLQPHVLYRSGRKWLVALDPGTTEAKETHEYSAIELPRQARGWDRGEATRVAFDCAQDPLVQDLLDQTSTKQWLDWIEKLSGVEPVTVAGTESSILTRDSSTTFSGASIARGYDFALQQAQSWGFEGAKIEEHVYGTSSWKNLVLTIPGETFPDEVVMVTGHLDSTSPTASTYAPGANDNGTGSATLFEAARLMRQFRWQRTVKIVFFTGEELGLLGSEAYVSDHPTTDILGVVNLDMFGWDGDGDRCFEIHAGTIQDSIDVGNCFADSLDNYGLGLSRDFLTTGATDRSDHASFWQVNVGAIEIAENFFSDGLPDGCVGSDANPGYHTVNDTIESNLTPSFGFDIGRAALATVAAMGVPEKRCFDGTAQLTAVAGIASVDLSWTAVPGAAAYRVYRSTQGCEGQWFEIAGTNGTSWFDNGATENVTYSYHVEAVDPDGFCVSAMSNCEAVTPTIYSASGVGAAWNDVCASGGPGDGDGIIDPGESVLVPIIVENDGNAGITQVKGVLTTASAGVKVIDPHGDWLDLDASAVAESLPNHFGLQVDPGVSCVTAADITLDLTYAEGTSTTVIPLEIGATQSTDLLTEDFAGGIPSEWIVVDGGYGGSVAARWTWANPRNRIIGPPFVAPFAIVDSDAAGSSAVQDEELITPAFDATACQQVVVEFSNQFRWYSGSADEQADLDVSIDDGVSWLNIFKMSGASDGYATPNTKSVEITSAIAADPSQVRVRFRYHTGAYEWWWAIDNVAVRCLVPVCNPCAGTLAPPGEPGVLEQLTVERRAGDLVFQWGQPEAACGAADSMLYRGDLTTLRGGVYAHDTALTCAAGASSFSLAESDPRLGSADYFLVVAGNGLQEGSYGRDDAGAERPSSAAACVPAQNLASCAP
jgi:Zn-dependent M28 family amino/carboxypeptidase